MTAAATVQRTRKRVDMAGSLREVWRADEDMTNKARRYMCWVALYCLAMGFVCVFRTGALTGPSFRVLTEVQEWGMQGWGYVHLVVGVTALVAAYRKAPLIATLALMGVAGLALPWAVGFALAYAQVPHSSPTGIIIYGIWAIVNIDQSRNPLTAPMERVISTLASDSPRGS